MEGMYNKLPQSVELKGQKFNINTDYRIFIDYEMEMQERNKVEAITNVLSRFYPAFSYILSDKELLMEAIDKFLWFYLCGKDEPVGTSSGKGKPETNVFSYEYDDLLIWGTYYQYFKVDLSTDYIHWWKFKAMWNTIPRNAEFSKIKGYRAYTGKDKNLLELKEFYKLPLSKAQKKDKERRDKIFEQLKGGK